MRTDRLAVTPGDTRRARGCLAATTTPAKRPQTAITDIVGYVAADHGRFLQRRGLLPPVLPDRDGASHCRALWHRHRHYVEGLPPLWMERLAAAPGIDRHGCRPDQHPE